MAAANTSMRNSRSAGLMCMVREMKRIRISSRNENNPKIVPRQAYLSADGLRSADAWEVHMARRSKRSSNQAKRLAKIDQDSRPKIVPLKLDAKALSRMVAGPGTTLPNLPNMQDNLVIQKLATATVASAAFPSIILAICFAKRKSRLAKITSSTYSVL
jgi:hypothetical protein